jgi:biopolymer transport protein ExbB
MRLRFWFGATAAALVLFASTANAWWSDEWQFRKEIRFDLTPAGADVSGSLTATPVLIRLSAGNFAYFGDARPDGSDLRFVSSDDVTPLSYQIERYDSVNQIALIWVRVPMLAGGANTAFMYMYYGNPDAVSASDASSIYAAERSLVMQFSGSAVADATAYANRANAGSVELLSDGLIAGAARLDGASAIVVPEAASLRVLPERGFTVSVWLRPAAIQAGSAAIASMAGSNADGFLLGLEDNVPFARLNLGGADFTVAGASALTVNDWHHVALRAEPSQVSLFLDGVSAGVVDAALTEIAGDLWFGGSADQQTGFVGDIDQVEFSSVALPDAQLRLAAKTEAAFSTALIYADDAQREGGGGENYFAVTLRNVTIDGWVVIVILGVMAFISWVVMILKGFLLSRISKQNELFLREYKKLGADPTALDRHVDAGVSAEDSKLLAALVAQGSYRPSTLFPLYHAGTMEINKRLQSPAVGAQRAGFSGETIGAIKAAIDAALVRERQKLNAQMVLLTISISGGPFLGLLGTVVGVMITFAAIAASGDVNVNSIAPGIAAALVATVAGLVVAIPALFGYNWLGSQIQNIDANSQVFVDEFIGRVAEHYS